MGLGVMEIWGSRLMPLQQEWAHEGGKELGPENLLGRETLCVSARAAVTNSTE